jgi:hypothetical protein
MKVQIIKQYIESNNPEVVITRRSGKVIGKLVSIDTSGKVKVRINGRLARVYPGEVYGAVSELHENVLVSTLEEVPQASGGLSGNIKGNWGRRKGF